MMFQWTTKNSRLVAAFGVTVTLMLGAACDDDPVAPDPAAFEGEIAGVEGFDDLSGTATLELDDGDADVTVALADYPDKGDGFPWILREGTCEEVGDEIGDLGDYPLIELDEEDEWTGTVSLDLDEEVEGYVLEIRRSEDDSEIVIGCGDLEEV